MTAQKSILSRFRTDRHGGMAIMGGFMISIIGAGIMAAVDITSMQSTKQKMQDRVDSAVLFATLQDKYRDPANGAELQQIAEAYMKEAVEQGGISADNMLTNFIYDEETDRIIGEVKFEPPAIFVGSIVAPTGLTVRAEAAPIDPTQMEVALVLDVSGSMNWSITSDSVAAPGSRRIDALRDGVDTLVNAIDEQDGLDAAFAVIPYATSVDLSGIVDGAGPQASTWFDDLPDPSNEGDTCGNRGRGNGVGADRCQGGGTEEIVVAGASPVGVWGAERYVAKNGNAFSLSLSKPSASRKVPTITQPPRTTRCADRYIEVYGARCVEFVDVAGGRYAEKDYFAPRSGVLGLTDNYDDVNDFMETLRAQGGTAGHIGAAWGLYALSEKWKNVFDHEIDKPAAFNSNTQKVMIVMTDGDFTMTHDDNMTVAETYDYFQTVCRMARSEGVTIYTVGLRASSLTDRELTACAGSSENYFAADSRDELIEAFEEIADKATRVRLSG